MNIEEAINEMIAQTVCESENLICEKDCPYYNKRKMKCTVIDKDFEPEKAVEGLKTALNELEKKDKVINEIKKELREHIGFEKRLIRDNIEPDLFNQGRFYVANEIKNILEVEREGK